MLRLILESLLGLQRHADALTMSPTLPAGFGPYQVTYRQGASTWRIEVRGDGPVRRVSVDGVICPDGRISIADDARLHVVEVERSPGDA